jgi:hypothetical protein
VLQERRIRDARNHRTAAVEDSQLLPAAPLTVGPREKAAERPVLARDMNRLLHAQSDRLLECRRIGFIHYLEIEQNRTHLIERLLAEHRPARRTDRVARILGRVVVGDRRVDARSLRQCEWLLVDVTILPVAWPAPTSTDR